MKREIIKQIPKSDLHRHFDGCIRPETIMELSKTQNIKLPTDDMSKLKSLIMMTNDCKSLVEYLNAFDIILTVLHSKENIKRCMFECCEDAYLDGLIYSEFRFAPCLCETNELSQEEIVQSCIEGIKMAEEKYHFFGRLILCGMRHFSSEESMKTAKIAVKMKKECEERGEECYIVGFDLAGPEFGFSASLHQEALFYVKENGINITIHAGEADSYESVENAIECSAQRIGHGISLLENEETIEKVKEKKVVVECCVTSNVQTKAIDSLEHHPIKTMIEKGIICTINTDNTTVSSCDLTNEIEVFQQYCKLNDQEICSLILNSFKYSFLENKKLKDQLYNEALNKMKELQLL